jgi:dTDP-4-dehydrorhamnose 3,5-epimerase
VPQAIDGVRFVSLTTHRDERGAFCELFREEWGAGVSPLQWNVVDSEPGVLRGVHVHVRHADYLTVVAGRATIGLRDLRAGSPTEGETALVELDGAARSAIAIPVGVAHGFLFHEPSTHVYAVSHYWDPADELACHWADPGLELAWPFEPRLVSERDASAGSLADLLAELEPYQPLMAAVAPGAGAVQPGAGRPADALR